MGGGNGQKAKMAREKNSEKLKGPKGFNPFFLIFFDNFDWSMVSCCCRVCEFFDLCRKPA